MTLSNHSLVLPNWPAPKEIQAFSTTRFGGASVDPYAQLNLGFHVGDARQAYDKNIEIVQQHIGDSAKLAWLQQVHGTQVLNASDVKSEISQADAMYSDQTQQACSILTADCLPVLFCTQDGVEIAAAHAGWKGLAAGVISKTLGQFKQPASNIMVWLGPAIGPQSFEVGEDVRQAFKRSFAALCPQALIEKAFKPEFSKPRGVAPAIESACEQKYMADIYQLARLELYARGIDKIYGGGLCTFSDSRFFSYRRDQVTGRMASIIVRHA